MLSKGNFHGVGKGGGRAKFIIRNNANCSINYTFTDNSALLTLEVDSLYNLEADHQITLLLLKIHSLHLRKRRDLWWLHGQ